MSNSSMTTGPGHAPPPGSAGGVKAHMLWHAVRRHPIVMFLLLIFAGAVAAGVWVFLPLPKLTGVAVFRVSSQPPSILTPNAENKAEFNTYKTMQAAVIKQRLVLNRVLNSLKEKETPNLRREPDQFAYLEQNLNVDFKTGPEFMRVTIEGNNEAELLDILTAVRHAYMAEVDRLENGARDHRKKVLERLRGQSEASLKVYQLTLTALATQLQTASPQYAAVLEKIAIEDLQQLRHRIRDNQRDLELAQEQTKSVKAGLDAIEKQEVPDAEIDRAIDQTEGVRTLVQAIDQKRLDVEELDRRLVDKSHPSLVNARKGLEDAKARLGKYRADVRPQVAEALKKKLAREQLALATQKANREEELRSMHAALGKAYDDINKQVGERSAAARELERTQEDIARTVKVRDQIVNEITQLDVERAAPLRVTEYGDDPVYIMTGIEGNRRLKAAMLSAAGTILVGLVGLVFWESRNRRILAVDDVGKGLGLRVFGTIPPVTPAVEGRPSAAREAALAEAVDTARTMLLYGTYGGVPKSVLVTSAMPGEGKTSLTGHLAISLAKVGYRTLLIDGDLRNPSNHRIFDVPVGPGLCEVLRGESDLDAAARPTLFPGLSILPAGRWNLAATQALAGDRWSAVRAAAEAGYDFVVIDSAPILPVVDSLLLARHVDGVLLSVMHDHSRVASVAESQHRLMSIGANLLGVVLNGIEPRGGRYEYAAYGYAVRAADPVIATTA